MELVTQLWAYKSDRFLLGVSCPEVIKNHIWLPLILLKVIIVGCSVTHLQQPHIFNPFFEHLNSPIPMMSENGSVYYQFRQTCKNDDKLRSQLTWYHYLQAATLLLLIVTYIRVLTSGVSLTGRSKK